MDVSDYRNEKDRKDFTPFSTQFRGYGAIRMNLISGINNMYLCEKGTDNQKNNILLLNEKQIFLILNFPSIPSHTK